jgi:ketosteroid isomerase-like protein
MAKLVLFTTMVISVGVMTTPARQSAFSDDAGRVLALETAWNHAIESKDSNTVEMLMADSMVAVESDGTLVTKNEYLSEIKAPDFQPSQAVNEKNDVHIYGDSAVAVGVFRIKELEKGKIVVHRERTVDTWIKAGRTWKCVAAVAVRIPPTNGEKSR